MFTPLSNQISFSSFYPLIFTSDLRKDSFKLFYHFTLDVILHFETTKPNFSPERIETFNFFHNIHTSSMFFKSTLNLPMNLFNVWIKCKVSTGIPGYGLRTEMIRKFFPFPLWKRFRKTGIPERFFSVKRKFPERSSGITNRSGNFPENRSGNFRFPEQLVP